MGRGTFPRVVLKISRRAVVLALSLAGVCGWGQDDDPAQKNTARVPRYPDHDQLVAKASALSEQGRYAEALDIYEAALRNHPNTLVPVAADGARAVSVRDYVFAKIAEWPPEAQALHRQRVDPQADHLFQVAKRAQDIDALERIADQFPMSGHSAEALGLAANLYLDGGENEKAASALSRLLDLEGAEARRVTFARLGLAYSRSGQRAALEALLRRVERESASGKVQVGGQEIDLAAHLKKLLERTKEAPALPALDLPAWEMMGGAPSGAKLAESGVELARLAWGDLVGLPRFEADDEMGFRRGPALPQTPEFRPLFPAVSDGILYVHNGVALTAYSLFARSPEKLWQFRVPVPQGEIMFDNRGVFATTVRDGRVFANLVTATGSAEDQLGYVRVKFPFPRRALFCLDAATGLLLWKLGGVPKAASLEENASFSVPPTPDGDRLYVGAVKQQLNTDPFDHYVLCLDAATGRIVWSTFVASGGTEINLFGNSTRESMGSPCAVTEDSVYYCTNHGVIVALDKKTGRPRWTYRYRQLPVNPTRSVYVTKNRLEWINAPPVAAKGLLAVTPADSYLLCALDAKSGELKWDRPRGRDVRSIFGAKDGLLAVGGERVEILDLKTGEAVGVPAGDELQGTGRGVVAADGIYVPCRDKLRKLGWDGSWDEGKSRSWPAGPAEGGNLLVVDGAIVLATQDSLQVYFDRRDQEKTIRAELAKDAENPVTLCRAALRFLQSGDSDQAASLLQKAIDRTAGSARPEEERLHRAARKRLFALQMAAARRGASEEAVPHLLAARQAAPDTTSRLEASVQLGRAWIQLKEDARAVAEFQGLLLENGDDVLNGARVFDLARNAIDAIVKAAGRASYAKQEEAARARLAEAKREGTPDAFLNVFQSYPNSEAAEEALLLSARAQGRLERTDAEITILRQALREYADSPRAPETQASLVRALEKKGHFASAGLLLRRMARTTPDAEVSEGEAKVRVRDWAERRLQAPGYARATVGEPLPVLAADLKKGEYTDRKFKEGAPLRVAGAIPPSAADLVFMNYGSAVKALEMAREGDGWRLREAWSLDLGGVELAAFIEEGLVLANSETIVSVDPRTGKAKWPAYQSPTRMRGFAVSEPFVYFLAYDPKNEAATRVWAFDAERGLDRDRRGVAWSQGFEGTASSDVHVAGEAVAFTTVEPYRINLFEAETGKRLLVDAPFTRSQSAEVIHASDDLLVLRSEGRWLEAYDLPGGKLRWRVLLQRMSTRGVEVGPRELVLLGTQRTIGGAEERGAFMAVVNLKSGKIARMQDRMDLGNPVHLLLDGERAFVISREADRTVGLRCVSVADLSVEWKATAGGKESRPLPPALAKDRVVLPYFEMDANGKYAYGGTLLDKGGRVVQNIKSGFVFERPPECRLANDRLIFSVDNKVEVHR